MSEPKNYQCHRQINFNNKPFAVGDEIILTDVQAKALLDIDAIEAIEVFEKTDSASELEDNNNSEDVARLSNEAPLTSVPVNDDADADTSGDENNSNDGDSSKAPKDDDDKNITPIEAIENAIRSLEKNDENFTNSGKPDAKKLSEICKFTVTAAIRDEVWEKINKEEN